MQRLTHCVVFFGALAMAWACSGDPTNNKGTPTDIVVTPTVVFVTQGDSEGVVARAVDEDGQILDAEFTVSDVGSGITVAPDPNFLPVTSGIPLKQATRFFVKGDQLTKTTFTLNALGLSKVVEVNSVPGNLAATISNIRPAIGELVTVTLPAGTFMTATSAITFLGQEPTVISQDSSAISFIAPPNIGFAGVDSVPAVISDVGVTSNANLTFTLPTSESFVTDSSSTITPVGGASPATAPALTVPAPGGFTTIFDAGEFTGADITGSGGDGAKYYSFTLPSAATLTIGFVATAGSHLDAVICNDVACTAPDITLVTGGASSERGTFSLAAGTHYLAIVGYGVSPAAVPPGTPPAWVNITLIQ